MSHACAFPYSCLVASRLFWLLQFHVSTVPLLSSSELYASKLSNRVLGLSAVRICISVKNNVTPVVTCDVQILPTNNIKEC